MSRGKFLEESSKSELKGCVADRAYDADWIRESLFVSMGLKRIVAEPLPRIFVRDLRSIVENSIQQ